MTKTAIAKIKYLKISPRKMVGICKLIRGKDVLVAKSILLRTPKKGARLIEKALSSAISNAKNKNLQEKRLIIKEIKADIGPSYKRFIPWSRGSPRPIKKRTTHLTIIVEEKEAEKKKGKGVEEIKKEIQEGNLGKKFGEEMEEAEKKPVKDKKTKGRVKVKVKKEEKK